MEKKRKNKSEKIPMQYEFTWKKMSKFLIVVWETTKIHPVLFTIMMVATLIDSILAVLLPWAAAQITTLLSASTSGDITNSFLGIIMHWYSWIYVCLIIYILLIIVEYMTNYTIGLFAARTEIIQRNKILISLVNQDVDFFFDNVSGNILTRLIGDTQGLALGIQQFLTNIVYAVGMFVTATIIMFVSASSLLGWVALSYIIFVLIVSVYLFIYFRRSMIIMFDYKRSMDSDMTDRINNITLIKSSGTEEYELKRTEHMLNIYNKKSNKVVKWSASLNFWISAAIAFNTTLIMIVAAILIINNQETELLTKIGLTIQMGGAMGLPVVLIAPTLRAATRSSNSANRISDLTDPIPTIKPNLDGPKIDKIDSIEFNNVQFAYPKKKEQIIIPNMNIKFEKGKSYAFVGETGSGKSTIGRLLLRYYEPLKGKIIINGKYNLDEVNLPSYLDRIGYVEQDPQIFFGDFFDNVRYSRFNATKEEVIEACKKANLHNFIMSLPEGYQTILGQRGFLLSGGQKQRLIIARVFLKNPDLIILDEATSALDNIVEKEIQAELDKLIKGKTSITIAHRLSTIKNVDQIIVLGSGSGVVQTGTFKELIKKDGHFKKLYEAGKVK